MGNGVVISYDPAGLKLQFCWRPVCQPFTAEKFCHWFLTTSQCGCVGYGKQGVYWDCLDHYGGYTPSCRTVAASPRQERCVCDNAKGASKGWTMCGEKWLPEGKKEGGYHWREHNCQYFTICLAKKCGLGIKFPPSLKPYRPIAY